MLPEALGNHGSTASNPTVMPVASAPGEPDRLEWALRQQLKGKTLLGEVLFDEQQVRCDRQIFPQSHRT
jgi:hypothetical protein